MVTVISLIALAVIIGSVGFIVRRWHNEDFAAWEVKETAKLREIDRRYYAPTGPRDTDEDRVRRAEWLNAR